MKKKNINRGAALLFVFFSLLFLLLMGRILYIQITGQVDGQVLAVKAQAKTLKQKAIESQRGLITDRNGEVIAEDTSSYTLVAVLNKEYGSYVKDPEETAAILAQYINMEEDEILERLTKEGRAQVEFGAAGRDISHTVKKEIEALELPGITFTKDTKRFYPNGVFASHVIGYVEKQENEETGETETVGMLGIEKMLQDKLQGTDGKLTYESDRWGFLLPNKEQQIVAAEDGNNVELTLDKKIQSFVEDALTKVQSAYDPEFIIAIVANPKTGEILAMGQRPSFNPTTKEGIEATWRNLAIEESFEPGSTMKVYTLAAAVEEGVFYPNATFTTGTYTIGNRVMGDHSGIKRGVAMTYLQAVQRSSNVGFIKLGYELLGKEKLQQYLTDFGFAEKTGIDLPNEVGSSLLFDRDVEVATTSFGQGSVVTPIQQIQAFTAIANDGEMMKPYVVSKITDASGEVVEETEPTVAGTPISADTAKTVREYLETVITDEKATGTAYAIEGYSVAGKTGTAQISGTDGKYLTGASNYIFSFIGMAPADDPELIMYVAVKQPNLSNGGSGTDALSSIFNPVMKNSLQYLNIASTETTSKESASLADYEEQSVETAVAELTEQGYTPIVLGSGDTVTAQSPAAETVLIEGEKVLLLTEGTVTMPDLLGWSLRDVMKLSNMIGLELNTAGSGYVTQQSIASGTAIEDQEHLIVEMKSPDGILTSESVQTEDENEITD
ncbi:MAG: penicillin-binding protein [Bacillus sp. (in: firmicutes)]